MIRHACAPARPGPAHAEYTSTARAGDIGPSPAATIAASWPTAPCGLWGNPEATPAGPAPAAAGTVRDGAGRVAGTPPTASAAATDTIGRAAITSRTALWPVDPFWPAAPA